MATITPFFRVSANFIAAVTAPPLLIPAKTPSSFASFLVISRASVSLTSITVSTFLGLNIFGKNSGDHFLIPGILELSVGCAPII